MSSNAEIKISGFPEDDGCWFIKWIDEFRLPYLATSSASVKVILQKLSSVDFHNLNNLGSTDIQSILGQRKKDADLIIQIRCPVVMPGTLPLVFIGAIYQRGVYVGRLPTHQRTIELADGGQEGLELSLSQQITPPPGWPSGAPHSLLNRFEYSVVPNIMKSSMDSPPYYRAIGISKLTSASPGISEEAGTPKHCEGAFHCNAQTRISNHA